jgi:hypothetical protein
MEVEVAVSLRTQRICLYMGLAFPFVFFIGWGLIAGFLLPIPSPAAAAGQIQQFYVDKPLRVQIGLIVTIAASALQVPFAALISTHMRRIEGQHSPLSYAQMLLSTLATALILVPCFIWAALAFRPEQRDPQTFLFVSDLAWLMFVGTFAPGVLQSICFAICVLSDDRQKPVFPRWAGYFNLWVALLFMPGALVIIFKNGLFAWNGLMGWWVPAVVFGSWFLVMCFILRQAIADLEQESVAESSTRHETGSDR